MLIVMQDPIFHMGTMADMWLLHETNKAAQTEIIDELVQTF